MEDIHSRAFGVAHSAIIAALLKKLIEVERLTPHQVQDLLHEAGQALVSKRTEAADGGSGIVIAIGEEVGVSPSQIGNSANAGA